MRIIDLREGAELELWPGRKIQVTNGDSWSLLALPRGGMSLTLGQKRGAISFGTMAKTICTIQTSNELAKTIYTAISDMERPDDQGRVMRFTA